MFNKSLFKLISAAAVFCLPSLLAHHQFNSEFDASKPVRLTGQVHDISWTEPHVNFVLDDTGGQRWKIEAASPSALLLHEFTGKLLKDGATVTVQGFIAKDDSLIVSGRSLLLNDHTYVIADPDEDGGPLVEETEASR